MGTSEQLSALQTVLQEKDKVIDIVDEVLSITEPFFDRFISKMVDTKAEMVFSFINKGFTKEEAIMLTLDIQTQILNAQKRSNT